MKAIAYHEYGSADVLRYTDVPEPTIGDSQVLVRVKAVSINQGDRFAIDDTVSGRWASSSMMSTAARMAGGLAECVSPVRALR